VVRSASVASTQSRPTAPSNACNAREKPEDEIPGGNFNCMHPPENAVWKISLSGVVKLSRK
jgi:hypothetical protein